MRKLNFNDVFAFARLLQTIGAKDILKKYAVKADSFEEIAEGGFLLVWDIFEAAATNDSQQAIYDFLADVCGCDASSVGSWSMDEMEANIGQIADMNDLGSFFKRAAASMSR